MDKKPGYILIVAMMMIALATTLVTSVVQRLFSYRQQARIMLDREKARTLALGGIHIALGQLALIIPQENNKDQEQATTASPVKTVKEEENPQEQTTETKQSPQKRWLIQVLPLVNNWQKFSFTEKQDQLDGELALYISSEQGKINLNYLLNASAQEQKTAATSTSGYAQSGTFALANNNAPGQEKKTLNKALNELLAPVLQDESFMQTIEEAKKQLGRDFEDVTELLKIKTIQQAFQDRSILGPDKNPSKKAPYITDLFTIYPSSGKINPWFISKSLGELLGFNYKAQDTQKIKELGSKFKPFVTWQSSWDETLKPFFGKSYASIPKEIASLFSPQFEATAFFVLSYATVGGITQKIGALLEKDAHPAVANASSQSALFKITKLYWL
jgi:type II secretory pathway component PulK